MLRVGFYQFRPLFGQIKRNLTKVIKALGQVSADVIVLPELPFTGYYFKDRDEVKVLAEDPESSSTVASLIALCKERNFYLVTGFAEKKLDKYFNSALLIGPEGIEHTYRKLHLFNEEKHWFDAGDTPLQVQEVRGAKLGLMVCFDWIFPEVTRVLAIQGADIICHPSNLVLSYCQQTMLSRCLENGVFAITANRFGTDKRPHGELRFTGKSQMVAPKGELLHRAASQREVLFITEIDPDLARDKNITWLNQIIQDRRPEFYSTICKA
jgi:predicted amidohydrolase